jgi:hypothetical protein
VTSQRWRDVSSTIGSTAKPLSAVPLVPYGDESEGESDSDQDGSGSIVEDHGFPPKSACDQERLPSGIGVYTRSNAPPDISLGAAG